VPSCLCTTKNNKHLMPDSTQMWVRFNLKILIHEYLVKVMSTSAPTLLSCPQFLFKKITICFFLEKKHLEPKFQPKTIWELLKFAFSVFKAWWTFLLWTGHVMPVNSALYLGYCSLTSQCSMLVQWCITLLRIIQYLCFRLPKTPWCM